LNTDAPGRRTRATWAIMAAASSKGRGPQRRGAAPGSMGGDRGGTGGLWPVIGADGGGPWIGWCCVPCANQRCEETTAPMEGKGREFPPVGTGAWTESGAGRHPWFPCQPPAGGHHTEVAEVRIRRQTTPPRQTRQRRHSGGGVGRSVGARSDCAHNPSSI